ncbi:MAG: hypothetical protein AAGA83_13390 [Cyanobacteria bacterium P01_F01_bin.116]
MSDKSTDLKQRHCPVDSLTGYFAQLEDTVEFVAESFRKTNPLENVVHPLLFVHHTVRTSHGMSHLPLRYSRQGDNPVLQGARSLSQ